MSSTGSDHKTSEQAQRRKGEQRFIGRDCLIGRYGEVSITSRETTRISVTRGDEQTTLYVEFPGQPLRAIYMPNEAADILADALMGKKYE